MKRRPVTTFAAKEAVMPSPVVDCGELPEEERLHPGVECTILGALEDLRGEDLERWNAARAPHEAEMAAWYAWRDARNKRDD